MSRYIDADKFAERIKASPAFSNMGQDGFFLQDVVLEILKKFPAVKSTADVVEVRHGRWIRVESSDMATGIANKCSECDKMRYGSWLPPYCSICGAKMDGERKDGNNV